VLFSHTFVCDEIGCSYRCFVVRWRSYCPAINRPDPKQQFVESLLLVFKKKCRTRAGYINEFEIIDDHRAGKIVVELNGRLNKCGVISPRFDVSIRDMERWTSNLLPSRQFG